MGMVVIRVETETSLRVQILGLDFEQALPPSKVRASGEFVVPRVRFGFLVGITGMVLYLLERRAPRCCDLLVSEELCIGVR